MKPISSICAATITLWRAFPFLIAITLPILSTIRSSTRGRTSSITNSRIRCSNPGALGVSQIFFKRGMFIIIQRIWLTGNLVQICTLFEYEQNNFALLQRKIGNDYLRRTYIKIIVFPCPYSKSLQARQPYTELAMY